MGCQTSNVLDFRASAETKIVANSPRAEKHSVQYFIDKQRKEFPDMEEWDGERYKGIGIKRMKGYKCSLQKDKLNQKREEFWNLRNSHGAPNYKTWRIINQACVYDEYRANVLMEEYNLTTYEGCINHIVDKNGIHYIIPNYCINDPYKYEIVEDKKEKPKEEKITFHLREGSHQIKIICSNYSSIEKVKGKIGKKYNCEIDKIRLFFYGKEMKNNFELWNYNVSNDCVVMVMLLR